MSNRSTCTVLILFLPRVPTTKKIMTVTKDWIVEFNVCLISTIQSLIRFFFLVFGQVFRIASCPFLSLWFDSVAMASHCNYFIFIYLFYFYTLEKLFNKRKSPIVSRYFFSKRMIIMKISYATAFTIRMLQYLRENYPQISTKFLALSTF